ncbi:scyllo-inositol 2-dehydrogenase (NADP+) [Seinonella peptonophila]|uniref:Scyllo-inositol 2-dehydrogenase (NADP+) n=1 Tax=Seinonella peptonophila TaxID=112248 RepID=A0A1M4XJI2_9BACL|nr:oxidoreductase [Seinonella peptonophila]SHE93560.1 scyllo-inositol 2-dehydrogenase (NADP+) [Seinonella peptonophila]
MSIRVGVVGYGLSGRVFHAPFLEHLEPFQLKAIVTSRVEQVKHDYPNVQVLSSFEDLIEQTDLDLIVITTPNTTHFPYAHAAIKARKHVVVEKPFTNTVEEADQLIETAQAQNVLLSVYQNRRYDNDFLTLQQTLRAGILGELSHYEAHFDRFRPLVSQRWREEDLPGSGILYDLGAHLIDQALVLFGFPRSIWADLSNQRTDAQTTDYFHMVLRYDRMRVVLHSSSLVRNPGPRIQIHGDQGSWTSYGLDPQEEQLNKGMSLTNPNFGYRKPRSFAQLTHEIAGIESTSKVPLVQGNYLRYYQEIAEAILEGQPVPVTANEGRNVIQMIELATKSHLQGQVIPIV